MGTIVLVLLLALALAIVVIIYAAYPSPASSSALRRTLRPVPTRGVATLPTIDRS